jgi:hypothetical protein
VPAIVSAITILSWPVRPAGVGHTSGRVNLEFTQSSPEDTWSGPQPRAHASLRRTTRARCFASAHPAPFGRCGRHSLRAGHNGKGLRASRESSDSANRLSVRDADRGSDSPAARLRTARDASTRSITVTSVTVRLFGRKAQQRGQRTRRLRSLRRWNLVLERRRPGGSRPLP